MKFETILCKTLDTLGFSYSQRQIDLCSAYWEKLLNVNQNMNLTAVTGDQEAAVKHFGDSLALLEFVCLRSGASLVDIGSGNGFPGLVLAIFCPDLAVTLLDSLGKRCDFLRAAVAELELQNVTILWGRAEDVGQNQSYRGTFDYAVARAVTALPALLEYALPLLKTGGSFCAYKGGDCQAELESAQRALMLLNGKTEKVCGYRLANGDARTMLVFRKTGTTTTKYPRRSGLPAKKPL